PVTAARWRCSIMQAWQSVKMLSNAQRKEMRQRQRRLIARLDELLPPGARIRATVNGAGGRALGVSGRSLHDVLEDVRDHLISTMPERNASHRPASPDSDAVSAGGGLSPASALPPLLTASLHQCAASLHDARQTGSCDSSVQGGAQVDTDMYRLSITESHSLVAIELSMPDWIITHVNPGARAFFGTLPWMRFEGQCLLNSLVHYDDVGELQQLWTSVLGERGANEANGVLSRPREVGEGAQTPLRVRLLRCLPRNAAGNACPGACSKQPGERAELAGVHAVSYSYVEIVMVPLGGARATRREQAKSGAVLMCLPCPHLDRPHTVNLCGQKDPGVSYENIREQQGWGLQAAGILEGDEGLTEGVSSSSSSSGGSDNSEGNVAGKSDDTHSFADAMQSSGDRGHSDGLDVMHEASGVYEFDASQATEGPLKSPGIVRAIQGGSSLQHQSHLSYSVWSRITSRLQLWGASTMLDSLLRLMQIHVQLDEDDSGVPYSRVHCRLKYLGVQTTWTLLWHVRMGIQGGACNTPRVHAITRLASLVRGASVCNTSLVLSMCVCVCVCACVCRCVCLCVYAYMWMHTHTYTHTHTHT
ncbi:MAG: hypothetical protein ACPIOQ_17755, partial [Promethearchaeia archaeon]